MAIATRRPRVDVALLTAFFAAHAPLQAWAYLVRPLPGLNEDPSLWPGLLAYGVTAPGIGYLLWTRKPRARLAAYVFLAFDALRAFRDAHWIPLVLDLAVLAYLQTPAMRQYYPSMWSRGRGFLSRATRR